MLPQIICLGAVNVDLVYRVADLAGLLRQWGTGLAQGGEEALSREGEARLQALLADYGRFEGLVGGGQAANTAYALARLGLPVALVGRVGDDADGDFLRESLAGVNLDYLVRQGESGRAYILLDPAGERTILVAPHTNDDLKESDLPREELAGARFLHLTSFAGDGPLEVQRELAGRLANGPRLTLDPGELYARRGRGALTELLDHVETLLLTEEEWARLGGEAKRHPDWAPPIVVVKRGAEGARMLTPVRYLDFPPEGPGFLVDTLGAGDVFAAGYLAGLFIGLNLPQAIRLAVKAAAYKLTGAARDRYPDREVLNRMIAQLR
jgi:sugar/nucleoside kinase (ribokinase family)